MIGYFTLGVSLLSLITLLFVAWRLTSGEQEEVVTSAVGFRYEPEEELDNEDGC